MIFFDFFSGSGDGAALAVGACDCCQENLLLLTLLGVAGVVCTFGTET
mgnify:CR=1 FL=1